MANISDRPADLPDFESPPLSEVVIGIQFNPPRGYQQINACGVWEMFSDEFPRVEEREPLAPAFETFGLPARGAQLNLKSGPTHDRFWFMRPDGYELIQFQQDRLLHNWRKLGAEENEYPRFETMMGRFYEEVQKLEKYVDGLSSQSLLINQCEITYVNHIPFENADGKNASYWLRFVDFGDNEPEDFSLSFREIIPDDEGQPQGRLTSDFKIGVTQDGRRVIAMTLTARGAPKHQTLDSAIDFLTKGRALIVSRFSELTTDQAHKEWGRIK